MIKLVPIYAENIIVGVLWKDMFRWYVTDKELWFLDYKKLDIAYGITEIREFDSEPEERKGLYILDSNNIERFLDNINCYLYNSDELQNLILEKRKLMIDTDELLDFSPSLYIDFNKKLFFSLYPEPASYEDYLPDEWTGMYCDFLRLIPEKFRYWQSNKGINLLNTGGE